MAQDGENLDRGDIFTPETGELVEVPSDKVVDLTETKDEVVAKPDETVKAPEKTEKEENKVPQSRMKEAVEKERDRAKALQAQIDELNGKLAAQTTSQDIESAQKTVKDLIKARNSHLGDGELDKAGEIDAQIFELQGAIAERKAEIKAERSQSQAVETMKYDTIVERLETEHAELNPDDEAYDEDVAMELRALMRGYQTELKLSASQALTRAAKRMFPPAAKAEIKEDKSAEEGLRRKAEATERNLDASKKQPASTKEVGLDHDKKGGGLDAKTVMGLPYKEFVKIGDDVLSKIRGDTL